MLLIRCGVISSLGTGVVNPIAIYLIGDLLQSLLSGAASSAGGNVSVGLGDKGAQFLYLTVVSAFCAFVGNTCWNITADNQVMVSLFSCCSAILY